MYDNKIIQASFLESSTTVLFLPQLTCHFKSDSPTSSHSNPLTRPPDAVPHVPYSDRRPPARLNPQVSIRPNCTEYTKNKRPIAPHQPMAASTFGIRFCWYNRGGAVCNALEGETQMDIDARVDSTQQQNKKTLAFLFSAREAGKA